MSEQHGPDRLSRAEIGKDAVQHTVEAAADTVGQVARILTSTVGELAGALGGFATEMFEIRDAARRAREAHGDERSLTADDLEVGSDLDDLDGTSTIVEQGDDVSDLES